MENHVVLYENFRRENHKTQVSVTDLEQKRNQTSRCAILCLGLLCAVLLAGNIGQLVYLMNISPEWHNCDQLQAKSDCEDGWTKFNGSCYIVSSGIKTWGQSRNDCIAQDADLVTLNSRDEEAFVNGLLRLNERAWIGLSSSLTDEWEWEWVDHTPVTNRFWPPNKYGRYDPYDPNGPYGRNGPYDRYEPYRRTGPYCGELIQTSSIGEWNNVPCSRQKVCICEKNTTNKL